MPIAPLLIKMSVPMMISMLVQALYNVVDSMFVARISENALTAVSLAYPIQMVMGAIAVGTGVGTNAFVSRSLGKKDIESAEKAADAQVFLSLMYALIFMIVGFFAVRPFFAAQTDIKEIIEFGNEYLSIVCIFGFGSFFCQNFEKLLIAIGKSTESMISQASGAVFNILFDWLLIFGIGPFPEMGIKGAAVATVLGQILSAALALSFLLKGKSEIDFKLKLKLPDISIVKNIYAVGIPSMLTIGLSSAMSFSMNQILLTFSTTATAVFGVWLKLQSFAFMPVFGMNNGTIAIFSYNYGAGNIDRIKKTLRLALCLGFAVTFVIGTLYEIIPATLLAMFDASENMLSMGISAIRLFSISLPFGAISIILSSSFQSLGKSKFTLFVNLCRQLLILLPSAWLLSLSRNLSLVWFAPLIAECATMLITLLLNKKMSALLREKFSSCSKTA